MIPEENNFKTVVIEGQVWAVTPGNEESAVVAAANKVASTEHETVSEPEPNQITDSNESDGSDAEANSQPLEAVSNSDQENNVQTDSGSSNTGDEQENFDPLRALTALLIGGAVEGTSQLVTRLRSYEEEIKAKSADASTTDSQSNTQEDEMDRLRYAFIGLVFDAQATFRRNLSLMAKAVDHSTKATNRVTRPVTNNFLTRPLQRRYHRLVQRGEQRFTNWVDFGRKSEPPSRELAKMTYEQIVDEFINHLAENPELQDLVTQQGIGLASEARDEVRERTVTADNLMEGIVRRILKRTPRAELPGPPPEVQRWANLTLDEYKIESKSENPQP